MLRKIIMICCCALVPLSRADSGLKYGIKLKKSKNWLVQNVLKFSWKMLIISIKSGNAPTISLRLKFCVGKDLDFHAQMEFWIQMKIIHARVRWVRAATKSRLLFQNDAHINFHIWKIIWMIWIKWVCAVCVHDWYAFLSFLMCYYVKEYTHISQTSDDRIRCVCNENSPDLMIL